MTRSRAKRVKEAMELIVQTMVDETSIKARKETSFMFGLVEDTKWINLIQVMDEGTGMTYEVII